MEQHDEIEMQLWEYMDGTCSVADMQRISVLVERDAMWKEKYQELSALHAGLSKNLELEQPSMRFTQNVMDAVAKEHVAPATKIYINKNIIRGIAAFFILMLTTVFGYALATAHGDTSATGLLSKLNFSRVNYGKLFSSTTVNLIIAINVVIGLVLFDTILRRKKVQEN